MMTNFHYVSSTADDESGRVHHVPLVACSVQNMNFPASTKCQEGAFAFCGLPLATRPTVRVFSAPTSRATFPRFDGVHTFRWGLRTPSSLR